MSAKAGGGTRSVGRVMSGKPALRGKQPTSKTRAGRRVKL